MPRNTDIHNANIDAQKWASIFAYVQAFNEYRSSLSTYNDAFHPEVTKCWDTLLKAEKEYKRMVKK